MKVAANILLVLGVCVASLGASGFHSPFGSEAPREEWAVTIFLIGLVLLGSGGAVLRASRRVQDSGAGDGPTGTGAFRAEIQAIQAKVVELDDAKDELSSDEIRDRIGELLAKEYFDLTSRSDDLIARVGFSHYARVWDGVATAERLLARSWSMCADGHRESGAAEIPFARASLDHAAREAESL